MVEIVTNNISSKMKLKTQNNRSGSFVTALLEPMASGQDEGRV